MPLNKDAFLAYAYLYTVRDGVAEPIFERLWKERQTISDKEEDSAEKEYYPDAQVLRVRHEAIDTLIKAQTFTARDFWRRTAEIHRNNPRWFATRGTRLLDKPENVPSDVKAAGVKYGLLTEDDRLLFHGVLLHGVKKNDRISWFAVRDDETFLKEYADAVAQTTRTTQYLPKQFSADRRAQLIDTWVAEARTAKASERPSPLLVTATSLDAMPATKDHGSPEMRVAVDSTLLLSADSYLGCVRYPDPQAKEDFEYVVNVFCACENVYLRKPTEQPKDLTPLLSLFWKVPEGQPPPSGNVPPPSDERLLANFEVLMRERPDDLRDLACHQLLDRRMDTIYWTGGNPAKRLRDIHRLFKDTGYLRRTTPLAARLIGPEFELQGDSALLAPDLGGTIPYLHAYLFNLVAKGPPYAHRSDGAVYYHSGWARTYALSGVPRERVHFAGVPAWGSMLTELEGHVWRRPILREAEEWFADGLWRLRDFTLNKRNRFDPLAGEQGVLEYLLKGLTASRLIPESFLGQHLISQHAQKMSERYMNGLDGEIVANEIGGYGRTVRKLQELARRIADGWQPIIADRESFHLEWEAPPRDTKE